MRAHFMITDDFRLRIRILESSMPCEMFLQCFGSSFVWKMDNINTLHNSSTQHTQDAHFNTQLDGKIGCGLVKRPFSAPLSGISKRVIGTPINYMCIHFWIGHEMLHRIGGLKILSL